jgi:ABC-2 type transport system ATP-binding protein
MGARELGRFVSGFYPHWDQALFEGLLRTFDIPQDRRASALSDGTRAKLALALALAPRPELLVLDEPTAGLDPVARREFLEIVTDARKTHGHTVIFSSHLVEEVERVATSVGILEGGTLRFEGPPSMLMAEMRQVDLAGQPAPPGFSVVGVVGQLGLTTLRAPSAAWESAPFDAQTVHSVSLDEAFVALVTRPRPVEAADPR